MAEQQRYTLKQAAICTGVSTVQLAEWRQCAGIRFSAVGYTVDQILQIIAHYPLVDEMKIIQSTDPNAVDLYRELRIRRIRK